MTKNGLHFLFSSIGFFLSQPFLLKTKKRKKKRLLVVMIANKHTNTYIAVCTFDDKHDTAGIDNRRTGWTSFCFSTRGNKIENKKGKTNRDI